LEESKNTGGIRGRVIGSISSKDGDKLIILLGGGTKKGKQKNIDKAEAIWEEYKERKAKQKNK